MTGELARAQLKKATGKDFGTDPMKWQDRVEKHCSGRTECPAGW
jgi:hypothetical protein